jgi:pantothenate kinase
MPSRPEDTAQTTLPHLLALKGSRKLIAVAGPPGSGKSSVSAALCSALQHVGYSASVVPMDGFHLDNGILMQRGLLERKGSPATFDAAGFLHLVRRIAAGEDVVYPVFDRDRDIAIAGAVHLSADTEFVIFEGNYLLLKDAPWCDLRPLWTLALAIDTPREVLAERLLQRWLDHGLPEPQARARRDLNDMPNADLVLSHSGAADLIVPN